MIASFLRMVTIPAILKNNSNLESRKIFDHLAFETTSSYSSKRVKLRSYLKGRITEVRIWKEEAVQLPSCIPSSIQLSNDLAESKAPLSCNFNNLS